MFTVDMICSMTVSIFVLYISYHDKITYYIFQAEGMHFKWELISRISQERDCKLCEIFANESACGRNRTVLLGTRLQLTHCGGVGGGFRDDFVEMFRKNKTKPENGRQLSGHSVTETPRRDTPHEGAFLPPANICQKRFLPVQIFSQR